MVGVALAWVAAQPFVSTVLVGSRKADQLRVNVGAALAAREKLSLSVVNDLHEATEALRLKLGDNPDYWQSGEEGRSR